MALAFPMPERLVIRYDKVYQASACPVCGAFTEVLVQGTLYCDSCQNSREAPYHV